MSMPEGPHGDRQSDIFERAGKDFSAFRTAWQRLEIGREMTFSAKAIKAENNETVFENVLVTIQGGSDTAAISFGERRWNVPRYNFLQLFLRGTKNALTLDAALNLDNVAIFFTKAEHKKEAQNSADAQRAQEKEIKELREQLAAQETKLAAKTEEISQLAGRIRELEELIEILRREAKPKQARINELAIINERLTADAGQRDEEIDALNAEKGELNKRIGELEHENQRLKLALEAVQDAQGEPASEKPERLQTAEVKRELVFSDEFWKQLSDLKIPTRKQGISPFLPDSQINGLAGARNSLKDLFRILSDNPKELKIPGYSAKVFNGPLRGIRAEMSSKDLEEEMRAAVPTLQLTLDVIKRAKKAGGMLYAMLEAAQLVGHVYALMNEKVESEMWKPLHQKGIQRLRLVITSGTKTGEKGAKVPNVLVNIDVPTIPSDQIETILRQKGLLPKKN